jgi:hypothetical protein
VPGVFDALARFGAFTAAHDGPVVDAQARD